MKIETVLGSLAVLTGTLCVGVFFYARYLHLRKDCAVCGAIPPCKVGVNCQPKSLEGRFVRFILGPQIPRTDSQNNYLTDDDLDRNRLRILGH